MILDIKDFCFYYGSNKALSDVNLVVHENEVLALIGPSGCGKSTFLRSLNRMNDLIEDTKYDGTIKYKDNNIFDSKYDVVNLRKSIGMVFQRPNPFPKSIFENIAHAPRLYGIKDKKVLAKLVEDCLVSVGLWDEVKDKLNQSALALSGGQQQRLCIARTIAMKPDIILMDEPTSALDPISTTKIENLIRNLKEQFTIIIVTHSMQQAARISDKTAFFLMGEVIEYNTTDIIFSKPTDKKTEDYITGKFG